MLLHPSGGHSAPAATRADSLELVLKNSRTPAEKISVMLELSREFNSVDVPRAMDFALKAYQISEESGDEKGKLNTMLKLIWLCYTEGDYTRMVDYATKSKE